MLFNQDQLLFLKFQKADAVNTEPESNSSSGKFTESDENDIDTKALKKSVKHAAHVDARDKAKMSIKKKLEKFQGKQINSKKDFRLL